MASIDLSTRNIRDYPLLQCFCELLLRTKDRYKASPGSYKWKVNQSGHWNSVPITELDSDHVSNICKYIERENNYKGFSYLVSTEDIMDIDSYDEFMESLERRELSQITDPVSKNTTLKSIEKYITRKLRGTNGIPTVELYLAFIMEKSKRLTEQILELSSEDKTEKYNAFLDKLTI
tara:strand:- start:5070 stop:5600 length:531 start_codon:yes stop_codon:yes gene_type:complete